MRRSTSESNTQGWTLITLYCNRRQITVQNISLIRIVHVNTAKVKMGTNTSEGIICKGWGRNKHKLNSVVTKV